MIPDEDYLRDYYRDKLFLAKEKEYLAIKQINSVKLDKEELKKRLKRNEFNETSLANMPRRRYYI
jgi:hypothetical protein